MMIDESNITISGLSDIIRKANFHWWIAIEGTMAVDSILRA